MHKFYISAYNGEPDHLGIFLYNEPVFFLSLHENHKGTHDFRFKLEYTILDYDDPKMHGNPSEKLDFVYKCDLKDFIITEVFQPGTLKHDLHDGEEGKPVYHDYFNYKKLVTTAVPELYDYVKDRLKRKLYGAIPEPVIFTARDWGKGSEFLQVDEFTSFAGNFEQNDKEGCCMDFGPNPYLSNPNFNWTIDSDWQYHDLPTKFEKREVYSWPNKEKKKEYFYSLPLEVQRDLGIKTAKRYIQFEEEPRYFPYRIYLYGTDDSSYSKWFIKEEDMMEEVRYLRKMQPLNLMRDLLDRGFVFTN